MGYQTKQGLWSLADLNGVSVADLGGVAVDVEGRRQVFVEHVDVVAAVQVVVDKHLPVALHVVGDRSDPGQPGWMIGLENPDLLLGAVPDVVERRRLRARGILEKPVSTGLTLFMASFYRNRILNSGHKAKQSTKISSVSCLLKFQP